MGEVVKMSFESVTIDHILKRVEEDADRLAYGSLSNVRSYKPVKERADAIRGLVAALEGG